MTTGELRREYNRVVAKYPHLAKGNNWELAIEKAKELDNVEKKNVTTKSDPIKPVVTGVHKPVNEVSNTK